MAGIGERIEREVGVATVDGAQWGQGVSASTDREDMENLSEKSVSNGRLAG